MARQPLTRAQRKKRFVDRVYTRLLAPAKLERRAAKEALAVIRDMGAAIQQRIRSGPYFDRPWEIRLQEELKGKISNVMAEARAKLDAALRPIERLAAEAAVRSATAPLKDVGFKIETLGTNLRQVELMSATRADLVQKVFEHERLEIDNQIQQVALGVQTPWEGMQGIRGIVITRMKRSPETFGKNVPVYGGSVLYQTERIVRTEVNRIYSVQNYDSVRELRNEVPGMRKKWVTTLDSRTRESHIEVNGEVVDLDDYFSNNLLFPHDPAGSPEETISCRCRLTPWLERWGLPAQPSIVAGIAYLRESERCYRMLSSGAMA